MWCGIGTDGFPGSKSLSVKDLPLSTDILFGLKLDLSMYYETNLKKYDDICQSKICNKTTKMKISFYTNYSPLLRPLSICNS